MRFHLLGLPHTSTTRAFDWCAYTGKIRKWATMMHDAGHTVYLYGGPDNEARCTEHIEVAAGKGPAEFGPDLPHWQVMNARTIDAMRPRVEPRDVICVTAGRAQQAVADAFPQMLAVEIGVGYEGTFAPYRIFESYAWMHTVYGNQQGAHTADGRFYDAVIPNFFDPDDFHLAPKDDYFLYLGRLISRKGVCIAADVCRHLGVRLIVAGDGPEPPDYGELVGRVGVGRRAELLAGARALFAPTLYVEPFGGVAVEAMLSGTPVISTDWGAFTETIDHGVTGFRCRTLVEFVEAADSLDGLADAEWLRFQAIQRWGMTAVQPMYDRFFARLEGLWGEGWSALPERVA